MTDEFEKRVKPSERAGTIFWWTLGILSAAILFAILLVMVIALSDVVWQLVLNFNSHRR